jgi:hypothetical protein
MPRKTTKKPTTKKPTTRKAAPKKAAPKKVAARKTAPKRKAYQTGGTAKPQMPRSEAYAREQAREEAYARAAEEAKLRAEAEERARQDAVPPDPMASQYADRINATMERYRREQGLMELGNRQRAAAARARTRSTRGPTAAEQARNMAEYERAMRARQANLSRGSTPSPRPTPRPAPPSPLMSRNQYQQELQNRRIGVPARPPATSINVGGGRALPAIPNPNYRPPVRPNPTVRDPSSTRTGSVFTQQMQAERSRIQQQIAQLQARLRQLGG